uniref:uncharacterized protein LOC124023368 n=1 Tax=Oncorhynchus gorbuscha TaxID=8017 RepID=UPI001EAF26B9|nr:uncharacterized protein LOC124023368 [Oncorhynchus gorbuscha]
MSRRSMRLVLGGYYNQSSEDDESSSVSYRESPVRVFTKRKRGGHNVASTRTSSRANTTSTMEPLSNAEDNIGVSSLVQRRKTFQEPPSVAPAPAPILNLAPSPRGFPSCQTSLNQAQSQSSAMDSSGYSSSEARHFKGYSGYTSLYGQRASASQSSGASRESASWTPPFVPAGVGKAILIAFLLLLTFGCWHLAPLVWSTLTPTMTLNRPVITPTPPPVFSLPPKAMDEASVFNSALEAKMNTILTEIETLKKQEHQQKFVTEMVERLQTDLTDVRTDMRNVRVDSVDPLDWERRLSQQTAGFSSQVDDLKEQHTHVRGENRCPGGPDCHAAATGLLCPEPASPRAQTHQSQRTPDHRAQRGHGQMAA